MRGLPVVGLVSVLVAAPALGRQPVDYRLRDTVHLPMAATNVTDGEGEFFDVFCAVLRKHDPAGHAWGPCDRWLERPKHAGGATVTLPPLDDSVRIAVVPGLMAECIRKDVQTYSDAARHLQDEYGIDVEILSVPAFEGSAAAGRRVAVKLRELHAADPRKRPIIVIGYSKGACDALEAMAHDPTLHPDVVAALVTVAGAIGGSRVVDLTPEWAVRLVSKLKIPACGVGADSDAIKSLRRDVRQAWLAQHPAALAPTFSLACVSRPDMTSRVLERGWRKLAPYATEQDSQVIASEAVAPGATFVGVASCDHWAVALPFEESPKAAVRRAVDKNHFPRALLVEALVSFVLSHPPVE